MCSLRQVGGVTGKACERKRLLCSSYITQDEPVNAPPPDCGQLHSQAVVLNVASVTRNQGRAIINTDYHSAGALGVTVCRSSSLLGARIALTGVPSRFCTSGGMPSAQQAVAKVSSVLITSFGESVRS